MNAPRHRLLTTGAAALLVMMITGCGKNEDDRRAEQARSIAMQEQRIRDNPNMPPQAKQAAIRALQSRNTAPAGQPGK